MKNRKWVLFFLILFICSLLALRKSNTTFYQIHMTESEAAIFTGTVVGLYTAYRVHKAARAVYKLAKATGKASKKVTRAFNKSKRELAKKCNKIGDLYQSFKGGSDARILALEFFLVQEEQNATRKSPFIFADKLDS